MLFRNKAIINTFHMSRHTQALSSGLHIHMLNLNNRKRNGLKSKKYFI